jgi:hypothetical protein
VNLPQRSHNSLPELAFHDRPPACVETTKGIIEANSFLRKA